MSWKWICLLSFNHFLFLLSPSHQAQQLALHGVFCLSSISIYLRVCLFLHSPWLPWVPVIQFSALAIYFLVVSKWFMWQVCHLGPQFVFIDLISSHLVVLSSQLELLFCWHHLIKVFCSSKQLWRVPSLHVLYFLLGWALYLPPVSLSLLLF